MKSESESYKNYENHGVGVAEAKSESMTFDNYEK